VLFNLIRGGIDWRGTFYPLKELEANMVLVWPFTKLKKRLEDLP